MAAALAAATPAAAKPIYGCFTRAYDAADLAAAPAQVVEELVVQLTLDEGEFYTGFVAARFAAQGRVAGTAAAAGAWHQQWANCVEGEGGVTCSADCGGGMLTVVPRQDGVDVVTSGFGVLREGLVNGPCAGTETLAEVPGQPVTYRLYTAHNNVCSMMSGEK
ncbi:hypothetical protein [Pseudoroseicyclus sp. CXY001]|uniref:hypothetical protein n=1 Tax=Pseudoroseicyclus sp. CXY001 TaxID=3242492 RepID=UPI0035711905